MRKTLPNKRDRIILLPAIGAQLIAGTSLFLMPILIDALEVKAGVSRRAAGLLLSMELVASAVTTLVMSARVQGRSRRRWALLGGFLAIAGTAVTLVSPSLSILFASRLIAGLGAGVVYAQATSILSRAVEQEKLISIVTVASVVNAAIWLAVLPGLIDTLGYRGPYICLLLIGLAGTYLLKRLPSPGGRYGPSERGRQPRFDSDALLVIVAIFLTQLGQGAFWSLEETFGSRAGFSSHAIGVFLSSVTLLLLLGAVASSWISNRLGRYSSLLLLVALNATSIFLVSTATAHWMFIAANVVQSLTNLSSVVCQLGLAANLDQRGRVVAAAASLVTLGNGLGPGLSAYLSSAFGAPYVGVVVLGFNCAALILYCAVKLRRAKRLPAPAHVM